MERAAFGFREWVSEHSSEEDARGGLGHSGLFADDALKDGEGTPPAPWGREGEVPSGDLGENECGSSWLSLAGFGVTTPWWSHSAEKSENAVKLARTSCY